MTWQQLAKVVAHWHGQTLTDDDCEFILWERTCFPHGRSSMVAGQVALFLRGYVHPDYTDEGVA